MTRTDAFFGFFCVCIVWFIMCMIPAQGWTESFPGSEKILDRSLIEQASKSIAPVPVIVMLQGIEQSKSLRFEGDENYMKAIQREVADTQKKVISRVGADMGEVGVRLGNLPVFGAELSYTGLKSVAGMDDVAYIEEDLTMDLTTSQGIPMLVPGAFRTDGSGKHVSVAIIDTGVNYRHPALGGGGFPNAVVIGGYDFGDNDADPMDMHGHGSSCAGIVAGKILKTGDYVGGVAPGAGIYALKVMNRSKIIKSSAILAAWDWCITHQNDDPERPIKIISQSLGRPSLISSVYCRVKSAETLATIATNNGIAIFVSSGNDAQTNGISFSSCLEQTISVGAVYDGSFGRAGFSNCVDQKTARDQVTCYSNSAPILDLLAPSHMAYTPGKSGDQYATRFGGTSAACPYAAGAGALIQSYCKSKTGKFLSVNQLRNLMAHNGDPISDRKSGVTKPRVNIARSISAIDIGRSGDRRDDDSGGGDEGLPIDQLRDLLRDSSTN